MLKTELIKETPVYYYEGCCPEFGQEIRLFAHDLKIANVGDQWECDDQDCYPNRTKEWIVSVKVIYKDEHGVVLLERVDNNDPTLIWVELH